jgi:hypothetical protein
MKQFTASILALSAITGAFWFQATPIGEKFCKYDNAGLLMPYQVVRFDFGGAAQTLRFRDAEHAKFCAAVPR